MTKAMTLLFGAALTLLASPALAQTPPAAKPPRAAAKDVPPEVERGLYTEFDFGTLAYLGDAGSNVQPGVMAGFAVGSDIGRYLKVELRMLNATSDSTGTIYEVGGVPSEIADRNPCPSGNPGAACTAGPDVQSTLVTAGLKAVYPVSERFEVQLLGGGGVLLGNPAPSQIFEFNPESQLVDPTSVESGSTVIMGGGAGIEFYTHLRHFSVGADLAVWIAPEFGGMMVTVFPTIKYTF